MKKSNYQGNTLSGNFKNIILNAGIQPDSQNKSYKIFNPIRQIHCISCGVLKFALIISFLSVTLKLSAPDERPFYIFEPTVIEPFNDLIYAIGMVETMNNHLAYNAVEQAAGFLQIRPVRLEDYNMRTGNKYILKDMFDPDLSKKVFLYYASRTGPYNLEKVTRDWNGSGPQTELYWNRVKKFLPQAD